MGSKGFIYSVVKELGKGAGMAEKVLIKSKDWLSGEKLSEINPDDDLTKTEILAKRKKEGDLTVLSAGDLKEIFKENK